MVAVSSTALADPNETASTSMPVDDGMRVLPALPQVSRVAAV